MSALPDGLEDFRNKFNSPSFRFLRPSIMRPILGVSRWRAGEETHGHEGSCAFSGCCGQRERASFLDREIVRGILRWFGEFLKRPYARYTVSGLCDRTSVQDWICERWV